MSKLNLATAPLVVGVLCSLDAPETVALPADIVEVRLDKTTRPPDWLARCRAIEARGKPVLLTIRLRREGGDWPEDDEARFALYEEGLAGVSAVDVELASAIAPRVATLAAKMNRVCLLSHHDFARTPPLPELEKIIGSARDQRAVPKIATLLHNEADVAVLQTLLARNRAQPLCVIGMGDAWKETRVSFARLGSCLTYGYLDQPTAPGQWSAAELTKRLRETKSV
jgi:3-dehydroquinate dehydratase-1